jgi:hypothetical protein
VDIFAKSPADSNTQFGGSLDIGLQQTNLPLLQSEVVIRTSSKNTGLNNTQPLLDQHSMLDLGMDTASMDFNLTLDRSPELGSLLQHFDVTGLL